ncbi:class I SAM-dependent methyltransferase [Nocardia terpenica]|uniref:Methyltransferase type 11 n=1 Tax=Nocardia terpenica TaxID=455432 RepID=A0A291RM31_9NOCA|nr:class I SAM-dependent methyltransferase [Nocardia terpenica]ATL68671.1 methyltransferase type 11 [Nocardia terpenica]
MDWVREFYSATSRWWAKADAMVTDRDRHRVNLLREHGGASDRVLELGSGYGATAVALAQAGYEVTAVEISDRIDHFSGSDADVAPGSVTVHKADFYEVCLPGQFDIVCYWNGFGVGSDADQRRLLARIERDWLQPGGVALIDVANPFVWARWDGDEDRLPADPDAGYDYELVQRIRFDPITCTAIDTWWEPSSPDKTVTQFLRCYTPADLTLLLSGTGLTLTGIVAGDQVLPPSPHPSLDALLRDRHEYLAIIRRTADI